MAEDFDLDRVINDPAYRRQVISRLNKSAAAEKGLVIEDAAADPSPPSSDRPPSDRSGVDRASPR